MGRRTDGFRRVLSHGAMDRRCGKAMSTASWWLDFTGRKRRPPVSCSIPAVPDPQFHTPASVRRALKADSPTLRRPRTCPRLQGFDSAPKRRMCWPRGRRRHVPVLAKGGHRRLVSLLALPRRGGSDSAPGSPGTVQHSPEGPDRTGASPESGRAAARRSPPVRFNHGLAGLRRPSLAMPLRDPHAWRCRMDWPRIAAACRTRPVL